MNNDLNLIQCTLCGCNEMIKEDQDIYRCKNCNALYNREDYQKMINFNNDIVNQLSKTVFEENEKKNIGKARQNLFNELNKQLNKDFLSSKDIIEYAEELKKLVFDDVLANFFSLIDNPNDLNEYMTKLDYNILQKPQKDLIVKFLLRYIDLLKKDNISIELNELIETYGRTSEEYNQYYTQYHDTIEKINEGYFDVSLHRDVFVAHSGKDKEKVKEIVKALNNNGFKCFVSFLNLFHGSGEQDDYRKELQKAMDNCSIFLFVSSNNSRFRDCEAITIEMQYIKDKDLSELPKEFKNIPYDKLDFKYKKPRVEFILEDYNKTNTIGETKCKEFFAGLERIYNSEELIKRIDKLLTNLRIPAEQTQNSKKIKKTNITYRDIDLQSENIDKITFTNDDKYRSAQNNLEHGLYLQAVSRFREILYDNPKNYLALVGEFLAIHNCKNINEYVEVINENDDFSVFDNIFKLATEDYIKEMVDIFEKTCLKAYAENNLSIANKLLNFLVNYDENEDFYDKVKPNLIKLIKDGHFTDLKDVIGDYINIIKVSKTKYLRFLSEIIDILEKQNQKIALPYINEYLKIEPNNEEILWLQFKYDTNLNELTVQNSKDFISFFEEFLNKISLKNRDKYVNITIYKICKLYSKLTNKQVLADILDSLIKIKTNKKSFKTNLLKVAKVFHNNDDYEKAKNYYLVYLSQLNNLSELNKTDLDMYLDVSWNILLCDYKAKNIDEVSNQDKDISSHEYAETFQFYNYENYYKAYKKQQNYLEQKRIAEDEEYRKKQLEEHERKLKRKRNIKILSVLLPILLALITFITMFPLKNVSVKGMKFRKEKGNYVLYDYNGKTNKVIIPASVRGCSVTSISDEAFYGCSSLTSVTIGNSVTSIGKSAFKNCSNLISIIIPDSVKSIGNNVFKGCSGLVYNKYDNAYYLGNEINKYLVLKKSTSTSITNCNISEGCKIIYYGAFEYCSSLTSITIPDSVTSIGSWAFSDCSSLTSITIPNSVKDIGWSAFSGCKGLTSVTIGNSVTSIGKSAFEDCSSLTSIAIPDSVTSIGESVFYKCRSLTNVTIGNSVTSIGKGVFANCSSLTSINFSGTKSQWAKANTNNASFYDYFTGKYTIYCTDGVIEE